MTRRNTANRGAFAGAMAALTASVVCLACVLPGIGAIVGLSVLVTAVGGIAEDGVLLAVGIVALAISLALVAFVVVARQRREPECSTDDLSAVAKSND